MLLWDVEESQKPWSAVELRVSSSLPIFSPDGSYLVWGADDATVRRWAVKEAASEAPVAFLGHTKNITAAAGSPDNKLVAGSAIDGRVIIWDTATRKVVQDWQLAGAVHGVAFAADSRHLAIANGNGTAYILRLNK